MPLVIVTACRNIKEVIEERSDMATWLEKQKSLTSLVEKTVLVTDSDAIHKAQSPQLPRKPVHVPNLSRSRFEATDVNAGSEVDFAPGRPLSPPKATQNRRANAFRNDLVVQADVDPGHQSFLDLSVLAFGDPPPSKTVV